MRKRGKKDDQDGTEDCINTGSHGVSASSGDIRLPYHYLLSGDWAEHSVFVILAMVEFFIGYWQNGIALTVLAILTSPIGLPAIANFMLKRLDGACAFVEGLIN